MDYIFPGNKRKVPVLVVGGGGEESQKLSDSADREFQNLRGLGFSLIHIVVVIVIRCAGGTSEAVESLQD